MRKFSSISEGKPNLIEPDDEQEIVHRIFTDFLVPTTIKRNSQSNPKGTVFVGIINGTVRNFPKTPVVEKSNANWIVM